MTYYIKKIYLEREKFKGYSFVPIEDDLILSDLSKVNIFVGPNNTGKSRFLRTLFSWERYNYMPRKFTPDELMNIINQYKQAIDLVFQGTNSTELNNIKITEMAYSEFQQIQEGDDYLGPLKRSIDVAINANANSFSSHTGSSPRPEEKERTAKQLNKIGEEYKVKVDEIVGSKPIFSFEKVYIPTLRGLRPLMDSTDHYMERTCKDYFSENQKKNIFSGQSIFLDVKRLLLGNLQQRTLISEYQEFIKLNLFDGQEVTLIPNEQEMVLYVKIGKEQEQPIFHLGDGLQSLIILTFPLFINRDKKLLLFIEEPELFLHPGYQRKLLDIYLSPEFAHCQYFLTTHSNHFLDLLLDVDNISVFRFDKILGAENNNEILPEFKIENVSNGDKSTLEILGVKNSSVFLSNCTIWVEGVTDRLYLRHYLELYQLSQQGEKVFKEDIHFSFVEYGGNNITHWSFLEDESEESINVDRLCAKLFLITDKDAGKDEDGKKNQRHEKLKTKLGDRYYCLECREIENLISQIVLKKVIAHYEKTNVEALDFEITEEAYQNEYLGRFIDENLKNSKRKARYDGSSASKNVSGTISDKMIFCKKSIANTLSKEDLSKESIELCRHMYDFIKQNNK